MGKTKGRKAIVPWLTAKENEIDKRFIQVSNSILLNETFQSLSANSQMVYLCMSMESGGQSEFVFPKRAFEKYNISYSTARRSINELKQKRFITYESGANVRKNNKFKFCYDWKRGAS